jgi:murein L,D-transpeptidase YafK
MMIGRALAALALALAAEGSAADGEPAPCPRAGNAIAVVTSRRELWLCRGGEPTARFAVALGQGGIGKRRQGDGRTPIGIYSLGSPRPSRQFGTFIPIGYPTSEQSAKGFTGGAIGIHGPPRGPSESPTPATAFDWTMGCIATATDSEIEFVAEFVREAQPIVLIRR